MRYITLSFLFPFFILAQNLPDSYYFTNDNQQLLRGGETVSNGLYSEFSIDTVFLYFDQVDYWQQMTSNA